MDKDWRARLTALRRARNEADAAIDKYERHVVGQALETLPTVLQEGILRGYKRPQAVDVGLTDTPCKHTANPAQVCLVWPRKSSWPRCLFCLQAYGDED